MAKITINQDSLKARKEWKRHKVKDGSNIYRILPPFGDEETHNNYPFKYWRVIWGLIDPTTGKKKPFNSPMNSEEGICPVQEYLDLLNSHIDGIEAQMTAEGNTKDQIKERLKDLRDVAKEFRPNKVYSYNACDKAGTVGILDLKPTAHKAMKKQMMKYIQDYCQDPTSLCSDDDDSGVWFNVTREGENFDTVYDVITNQTVQKDERGRVAKYDDRSPLPEQVVETYSETGYDLFSLYKTPTYDELKQILILNLINVYKEVPEAKMEGFTQANLDVPVIEEPAIDQTHQVNESVVTKGTKKITLGGLNDADGDEDEMPAVQTQAVAKKAPKTTYAQKAGVAAPAQQQVAQATSTTPVSADDFMAQAEDILNS